MHANHEPHVRRRSLACSPSPATDDALNIDEPEPEGMLAAVYNMLGVQFYDDQEPVTAANGATTPKRQPLSQVLGDMSTWALRAAMLNVCLPGSMWQPAASYNRYTAAGTAADGSRCLRGALVGTEHVMDPMQVPDQMEQCLAVSSAELVAQQAVYASRLDVLTDSDCDKGKWPHGLMHRSLSSSDITLHHRQQHSTDSIGAAANPEPGMLAAEVSRLRHELSSLRSCVGSLHLTCSSLRKENQRLRAGDGGEALLGDALQQLLGEKSALQLEVSRLANQNKALQELLEYTAPAAAPSANEGYWQAYQCSGMAQVGMIDYCHSMATADCSSKQQLGYWLATPAASTAHSTPQSRRSSSGGSSCEGAAEWLGATRSSSRQKQQQQKQQMK